MIRIACYGVGNQFLKLKSLINDEVVICALSDKDLDKCQRIKEKEKLTCNIIIPEQLNGIDCDYIVVCSQNYADEMEELLIRAGVSKKVIIRFSEEWLSDPYCNTKRLFGELLKDRYVNKEKLSMIIKKDMFIPIVINDTLNINRARNIDNFYEKSKSDYVRIATLELISEQVKRKKLTGDVAELGVYQGRISAILNELFPEKKLYLFDTFDGFTNEDITTECQKNKDIHRDEIEDWFRDTSVEKVLNKMRYPQSVIIKKGFFPDSLGEMKEETDEAFCLVSIDPDLYAPTYEGIRYFYPRLVNGGYMLVHDYECPTFRGCREAIEDACRELHVSFVPLCDENGTVCIVK